jgi:hypothetical protein
VRQHLTSSSKHTTALSPQNKYFPKVTQNLETRRDTGGQNFRIDCTTTTSSYQGLESLIITIMDLLKAKRGEVCSE